MLFQVAFDLRSFVTYLQDIGFYEVFLPFLLVFAIVFAVLEKTHVLGSKKNINVVVSFAVAFLLLSQPLIVEKINAFLPRVSLILVVFLAILLVLSFITGDKAAFQKGWAILASIVALGAILLALYPDFAVNLSSQDKSMLLQVGLLVLGGIGAIFLITGGDGERGPGAEWAFSNFGVPFLKERGGRGATPPST